MGRAQGGHRASYLPAGRAERLCPTRIQLRAPTSPARRRQRPPGQAAARRVARTCPAHACQRKFAGDSRAPRCPFGTQAFAEGCLYEQRAHFTPLCQSAPRTAGRHPRTAAAAAASGTTSVTALRAPVCAPRACSIESKAASTCAALCAWPCSTSAIRTSTSPSIFDFQTACKLNITAGPGAR